jgi:hypothetical protein
LSRRNQSQSESSQDENVAKVEDSGAISLPSPSEDTTMRQSSDYEKGFQEGFKSAEEYADRGAGHLRNNIIGSVLSGLRFEVAKDEAPLSTAKRITETAKEIITRFEALGLIATRKK